MATLARLCLIGPESTGKSRMAERLARELGLPCAREFAREYALRVQRELTAEDVEPIARGEIANLEQVLSVVGCRLSEDPGEKPLTTDNRQPTTRVVLDTDLISTVVYARHYYGACPEWIEAEARARRADRYLLLDTDLEWKADPARDARDAGIREDLFDAFRAALEELECSFRIVSGGWEERWKEVRAEARTLYGLT